MYEHFLTSIIAATCYALAGYFKKKPKQPFSLQQLVLTISLGLIVGLVQFYMDIEYEIIHGYLVSLGLVALLESAIKLVWRKII
jgi:hypothetical protein